MRWLFLFVPLVVCECQPPPADEGLLEQVKIRLVQNLTHLPNYTCAETIERGQKLLASKKFQTSDTVHLEVALVEGHELYGWPGANRIAESELSSLVGGTIGNGDFALLVKSIFLASGTIFQFSGPETLEGRPAVRWNYRVPLISSGYRLRVPPNEALVGYHGSFWVHPDTLDLIRLDMAADDIPEALGVESCAKTIVYQHARIGASNFLLPRSSELAMADFNGVENRNLTTFHDCRQYSGESVLSFDDPPPDGAKDQAAEIVPVDLPASFGAELSLLTPINSESAAVGDPIQLKLEENIKMGRKLIVPKGAVLSGRISRLHRQQYLFQLVLALDALDFDNSHADLSGRENTITAVNKVGVSPMLSGFHQNAAESQSLVFEATRLHLPKGLLLYLKSRLVKSE